MPERAGRVDTRQGVAGRARFAAAISFILAARALLEVSPAWAATTPGPPPITLEAVLHALATLDRHEIVSLALTLGVLVFAVTTAIALVRTRVRFSARLTAARHEIARLRDEVDRAVTLLLSEPQVVVMWREPEKDPFILGDAIKLAGVSSSRRVLAFGSWLGLEEARTLEQAVDSLRQRGETFAFSLMTPRGRHLEAEGRPIGGAAVLRLRDITGIKLDHAAIAERLRRFEREVEQTRALLEAIPTPIWLRDASGKLVFANRAYAAAVETANPAQALEVEFLDQAAREESLRVRADGRVFNKRLPAVVAGSRRVIDVIEVGNTKGAAGIGIDMTEAEAMRAELGRVVSAHRRTLDELATAVAIFGPDERLLFHNAAYRGLFRLDAAFLEEQPTDSAVLDRLRAERKLPEQADFRAWKAQLFAAYRAVEPKEHSWHLPGGRILRVVTNPNPEGGVTYLFDDITERIELESRYNALIHTQGETLDALAEAVVVFGSDGRLKLCNPAFIALWKLSAAAVAENPHIEKISQWCRPQLGDGNRKDDVASVPSRDPWGAIQLAVTALERPPLTELRLELANGRVLDCASVPLPDGGTLVTFRDVSDRVRFERALTERNEALVAADRLKNAFVHHVSYELRSPLTTIIGFSQLLDDPAIGPLTDKQREYTGHITSSSAALLAIIDDILDLATIDAGAMTLEFEEVDVRATMEAATEGVRDRLSERSLKLDIRVPANIGRFIADGKRVRQVLFNLMSNAIGFSPAGETVTLTAERRADEIIFRVADKGPGIPEDIKERVFDLFESHHLGSSHRGAGLGLSIVRSLMALHGGSVSIDSEPGRGTIVTCIFPVHAPAAREAAE
jgi:signal transduction histidine kinase